MIKNIQSRRFRKAAPTYEYLSPTGGSNLQCIPEDDYPEEPPSDGMGWTQITPTPSISPCTLPPLFPRQHSNLVPSVLEHEDSPWELVNRERQAHGLLPFRLSRTLNRLAAQHASRMAKEGTVYHSVSTIDELKVLITGRDVAENIQRGDSVGQMHIETMQQRDCINQYNVLSTHFSEFGYGLAMGTDEKVYCCQLFRN
jgi:uncharacterized protein YkwD